MTLLEGVLLVATAIAAATFIRMYKNIKRYKAAVLTLNDEHNKLLDVLNDTLGDNLLHKNELLRAITKCNKVSKEGLDMIRAIGNYKKILGTILHNGAKALEYYQEIDNVPEHEHYKKALLSIIDHIIVNKQGGVIFECAQIAPGEKKLPGERT